MRAFVMHLLYIIYHAFIVCYWLRCRLVESDVVVTTFHQVCKDVSIPRRQGDRSRRCNNSMAYDGPLHTHRDAPPQVRRNLMNIIIRMDNWTCVYLFLHLICSIYLNFSFSLYATLCLRRGVCD